MRRIFNTTTALVACLSMIAPNLVVAQAQQDQMGDQEVVLPKHKKPAKSEEGQQKKPAEAKAEPRKKPQAQEPQAEEQQAAPAKVRQDKVKQAEDAPKKPRAQEAEKAEKPRRPAKAEPAQAEQVPAKAAKAEKQVERQPAQDDTPARKPAVTQADEPKAKPPVVEADAPKGKPAEQQKAEKQNPEPKPQQVQQDGEKQPGKKPDTAKSVTTADPAPDRKPQQKAAQDKAAQDQDGAPAKAAGKQQAKPEQTPDAEQLKKALQDRAGGKDAEKVVQEPAGNKLPAGKLRDQVAKPQKAGDTQAGDQRPEKPVPGAADLAQKLRDQQEGRSAQGAQPGKPQPGKPQPGEIEAPEARVKPNDVAKRAAGALPAAAAAALAAAEGRDGKDKGQRTKVDDVQITRDNARRSDQDFENSIVENARDRDRRRDDARKDDDNDNLKKVGALLLAGAAGFAVGKMLSDNRQVALNTGDRVVVTMPDGSQQLIRDDNALLYQPGSNVQTETFDDGSTRTTVLREDGSRVVTIRDANMNILRRTLVRPNGTETRLINDTASEPVRISTLPAPPPVEVSRRPLDETALREALRREAAVDRRFTLGQIRDIPEVRALVAPVNVPEITFDTGSAAITPDQAQQLATVGKVIRDSVDENPNEIYMIEGYTDAVGSEAANLALSDRRAESVALALTEYFNVPPENMVVQGYGEQFMLVPSAGPERDNRRVALRRITDLLAQN